MAIRNIWDGALSFGAAVITVVVCGVPSWFTFQGIQAGDVPTWAYAAVGGLAVIGILLTLAFLRKGFGGISPSRHRRR